MNESSSENNEPRKKELNGETVNEGKINSNSAKHGNRYDQWKKNGDGWFIDRRWRLTLGMAGRTSLRVQR